MNAADKLTTIAENVPKVYEAGELKGYDRGFTEGISEGLMDGYSAGLEDGYQKGQREEYDRFWDSFQQNGERISYNYAFQSPRWNDNNYNPKYPINASAAINIFANNKNITDTKVPIIVTGVTLNNTFSFSSLVTIRELVVDENTTQASNAGFDGLSSLQNLTITGTITFNLNLSWSPLTHESIMSVISALKDYSEDTSGTAHTITLGTTNLAKLTDAEKAIATEKGWTLA